MDWDRVEPHNKASRQAALATSSVDFNEALMQLQVLSRNLYRRFDEEFDLLLTPTMAIEPPETGLLSQVHASPDAPILEIIGMAAFTAVFNISGQPAVSLPLHVSPSGLPVGIQLVAGPFRDAQLVRVAAQLEAAAPWADRYPFLG
jgi:amidase